jgi:regulator of sirC expression with transglutaminase-like and TPR domain
MRESDRDDFLQTATSSAFSLAEAALRIARVEHEGLDPAPYVALLDEMGRAARERVDHAAALAVGRAPRLTALTEYLFEELGFTGDRERYDDPRNSFLHDVLERRSGIPISLAVVLLEVAARAGVETEGVNFPGHFLVRARAADSSESRDLLVDPFHGGSLVSEADCYRLLRGHVGDEAVLSREMFAPAGKTQILVRMLLNLKRAYVRMRSFPQARAVTDLLMALDPSSQAELRDRGLLAYHLQDFAAALRDLQTYLQLAAAPTDEDTREEREQIWEHVKALRRRLASFN